MSEPAKFAVATSEEDLRTTVGGASEMPDVPSRRILRVTDEIFCIGEEVDLGDISALLQAGQKVIERRFGKGVIPPLIEES